jgi:hypothetical protein
LDASRNAAGAGEDIGEGRAVGVDLEGLLPARRHRDVDIGRLGGDAVDRAALAPEFAADDARGGAVIIDLDRDVGSGDVLIARRGHLHRRRQVGPELEAVHLAGEIALGHFLVHDAASGGHPLHVSRAQGAGVAEAVAMFDGAGQHIGNGLDAAVRMPGKALEVVLRLVVAEIVKQQERIGERRIVESRMRAADARPRLRDAARP